MRMIRGNYIFVEVRKGYKVNYYDLVSGKPVGYSVVGRIFIYHPPLLQSTHRSHAIIRKGSSS